MQKPARSKGAIDLQTSEKYTLTSCVFPQMMKMSEATKTNKIDGAQKQLARDVFAKVPFLKLIGMELVDLKTGEAIIRLKMRDRR